MTDYTDPATGFTVRNNLTEAEYAAVQAAVRKAAQPEPAPLYGDVGQGVGLQQDTRHPLDLSRLGEHQYWLANRQAFLNAAAAGELTTP